MQTNPVNARSTFSNCHVLFRYLHSFVQALFMAGFSNLKGS